MAEAEKPKDSDTTEAQNSALPDEKLDAVSGGLNFAQPVAATPSTHPGSGPGQANPLNFLPAVQKH